MIIDFKTELVNAVTNGNQIMKKYDISVSSSGRVPKEYHSFYVIFEEDMKKLEAICKAADELDKRNQELERLVKTSGVKDKYDFYYPLGGGML